MKQLSDQAVRAAIDDCLSGVEALPSVRADVLNQVRGEIKVKKKLSAGVIFALLLALLMAGAAVAAGLGLFGQLGEREDADSRLPGLESVSEKMHVTFTTEEGVTVTIDQAYYDGTRVFISYTVSGPYDQVEMGEGKPENLNYDWELPGEQYAAYFGGEGPHHQAMAAYLDGSAPRWAMARYVNVHDGLQIGDAYLNIIGGSTYINDDGVLVGWKECEVPETLAADEVTFLLGTFTSNTTYYQDEAGLYVAFGPRTRTVWHPFTVAKDKTGGQRLTGTVTGTDWSGTAALTASAVDIKGEIVVSCPQSWSDIWETWENPQQVDYIEDWNFYVGGTEVNENEGGSIDPRVAGQLTFGVCYRLYDLSQELKLVPVFSRSGEHMDEAIVLTIGE